LLNLEKGVKNLALIVKWLEDVNTDSSSGLFDEQNKLLFGEKYNS